MVFKLISDVLRAFVKLVSQFLLAIEKRLALFLDQIAEFFAVYFARRRVFLLQLLFLLQEFVASFLEQIHEPFDVVRGTGPFGFVLVIRSGRFLVPINRQSLVDRRFDQLGIDGVSERYRCGGRRFGFPRGHPRRRRREGLRRGRRLGRGGRLLGSIRLAGLGGVSRVGRERDQEQTYPRDERKSFG